MRLFNLVAVIFLFSLIACNKSGDEQAQLPPEKLNKIIETGQQAAKTLVTTLKSELISAIEAGGPVEAIGICKNRAMFLTDSLAKASPQVINIRRTSFNYRNPVNAPDEVDGEVLRVYENAINAGKTPPQFQVREISEQGKLVWRYYHPMTVQAVCQTCHGSVDEMPEALRSTLTAYYPDDRATGYTAGDFRGVIRVTINDSE